MSALERLEALPDRRPDRVALALPVAAEPVPANPPAHLLRMLEEQSGDDRSGQMHAMLAAAVEWGLSDGEVLSLLAGHTPSVEKFGDRLRAEVERDLSKERPRHQHVGQPCDRAGCANAPLWMTGRMSGATPSAAGEVPPSSHTEPRPSGWQPVDLGPYLAGDYVPPAATLLRRSDTEALVVGGRVHWVYGEPECGKTWLAVLAVSQVLLDGGRVMYLDWEDGPAGMTSRLLALGVPAELLLDRLTYINPAGRLDVFVKAELLPLLDGVDLVVIDACTESLAREGRSSKDDTDIAAWLELLPRWRTDQGPAVVVLDHVVKDRENRGRWPTGSQHKLAGLGGVAYRVDAVAPCGRGLKGRSKLIVTKDRHAAVRGRITVPTTPAPDHWAGDLVVDDTGLKLVVSCRSSRRPRGAARSVRPRSWAESVMCCPSRAGRCPVGRSRTGPAGRPRPSGRPSPPWSMPGTWKSREARTTARCTG